ncbi:hypothetical protein D3C86_1782150 [compost metagenome]
MDNVLAGADFPTKNATKFKAINTKKKLICENVRSTILKITRNTAAAAPNIYNAFFP